MADLSPVRKNIQVEESRFRGAVSEALAQKMGSSMNFINAYQKYDKLWAVNGSYGVLTIPYTGIDGIFVIPDNFEIMNVAMYIRTAGVSGTHEMDVELATAPGGSWASIFSTTPKILSSAGSYAWCYTGSSFANTTAPVLGTTNGNAGSALRCNIKQVQGGSPVGCGLQIYARPR